MCSVTCAGAQTYATSSRLRWSLRQPDDTLRMLRVGAIQLQMIFYQHGGSQLCDIQPVRDFWSRSSVPPPLVHSLTIGTASRDHSLLAVATTKGLRVYSTDPFELTNHSYEEDISLVEQLFSTSLVAMILTPRLLRIVNTKVSSQDCVNMRLRVGRENGHLTRLSSESRNIPQYASSPSTAWLLRSR